MSRATAVLGATVAFFLAGTAGAFALWHTPATRVTIQAHAASVPAGKTPTGNVSGSSVTVSWPAAQATGGVVSGYRVTRYAQNDKAEVVTGSCAGVVTALTCTEPDVPNGQWRYTVRPVFGATWSGKESGQSDQVKVNGASKSSVTVSTPSPTPTSTPSASPSPSPSASVSPSPSAVATSDVGSG